VPVSNCAGTALLAANWYSTAVMMTRTAADTRAITTHRTRVTAAPIQKAGPPAAIPRSSGRAAATTSRMMIREMLKLPVRDSPQALRTRPTDRLTAATGPSFSTTRAGTTKKVIALQAMPSRPMMNLPAFSEFSSMIRKMKPTVALTRAQPRIWGSRLRAARKPSPSVGSPPLKRMRAQATRAELKKMITK
jgi:hypothetical protein